MKGRDTFTAGEAQEIRRLLRQKEEASRDEQKRIRGRIRRIGFYLSDWDASTLEDFDRMISQGRLKVSDGGLPRQVGTGDLLSRCLRRMTMRRISWTSATSCWGREPPVNTVSNS